MLLDCSQEPGCTANGLSVSGFHVVDVVEVDDGDGVRLLTWHHALRVPSSLQENLCFILSPFFRNKFTIIVS